MGILYIVSTPIGNLEDITVRAIKTLLTVDAIACEDTRKGSFLLKTIRQRYSNLVEDYSSSEAQAESRSLQEESSRQVEDPRMGARTIKTVEQQPLISYYEQNEAQRIPEIINALKNGLHIALISDAGTPLLSDPGFKLVREAVREGLRVESIPGASSVLSALTSSGLPTDKFFFVGYPPRKPGHRKQFFVSLLQCFETSKKIHPTIIMFEAPHKLVTTLDEIQAVFGDIEVCLARELTKLHEEFIREKISESLTRFAKHEPKGEFVILLNPK